MDTSDPNKTVEFEKNRSAHKFSDVDQTSESLHHTIGKSPTQAASGKDLEELKTLVNTFGIFEEIDLVHSGFTVSDGTARMTRIGKLITVRFNSVISGGVGTWKITPPVEAVLPEDVAEAIGSFYYNDGSTHEGVLVLADDGFIYITSEAWGNYNGAGTVGAWLSGTFTYEALS